jgi:hypothetical protein
VIKHTTEEKREDQESIVMVNERERGGEWNTSKDIKTVLSVKNKKIKVDKKIRKINKIRENHLRV